MNSSLPVSMSKMIENNQPPSLKCYNFLREGIMTGHFGRGHRIVERDVISVLAVSRTPLREALRKLEKEGLVEYSRNRGCTVAGFSGQDIRELFDLRKILGAFMIKAVSRNANKEELSALREDVLKSCQLRGKDRAEFNFHTRMLELARHGRLNLTLGQLEEYASHFHILALVRDARREQADKEYVMIIDALLGNDVRRAETLLAAHLDDSFEAIKAILAFV